MTARKGPANCVEIENYDMCVKAKRHSCLSWPFDSLPMNLNFHRLFCPQSVTFDMKDADDFDITIFK